jgi:uncharacterized protein YndB with AHSA1/START domain
MEIDIAASPEDVWRALTDAGELVRWFPLQARVTPGVGGTMFWGWEDHWASEARIEAWEPARRLRLVEDRQAFDVEGRPLAGNRQTMAMEFTLDTHAGRTRLRLVHSGFGSGESWDDELDSTGAGWQHELRSLRHYVQRHRGRDRHHAFVHMTTPLPSGEVWTRLLSPAAFDLTSGALIENQPCVIQAATGDQFPGTTQLHQPGWDVALIVHDLDDGLLRISTWRAGGMTGVQIWLAVWNASRADHVRAFGPRAQTMIERVLRLS